MRDAVILGIGYTRIGELWDRCLKDLAAEAALKAMGEASVDEVDSLYVGSMCAQRLQGQGNLGVLVADQLATPTARTVSLEAACASGGKTFQEAVKAVQYGAVETALAVGAEKLSDALPIDVNAAMTIGEDQDYASYVGLTHIGLQALIARLYMQKFEVTEEQLATFPVNAHRNSVNNPYAQFHNVIEADDVAKSTLLADPLRVLHCAGSADGAAAVVVGSMDAARRMKRKPIRVLACEEGRDTLSITERDNLLTSNATVEAANNAFNEARVSRREINLLEVHDCSASMGLMTLEDLGFVEKGKAPSFAVEGGIALEGKLPTNTMGGLKGRGHPSGATGIYQIVDLVLQLRGEAGKNQIANAARGLACNIGGVGALSIVTVLERM
ncbi:MAG: thiolase domain-containing protein [Candidatus Bathyarchaeia archaeon]